MEYMEVLIKILGKNYYFAEMIGGLIVIVQRMNKLGRFSEEEGFLLIKVPPAYTSQRCHVCNTVNKSSRQGEVYHCKTCGAEMDADINAAINILHLGVYSPQNLKAERQ